MSSTSRKEKRRRERKPPPPDIGQQLQSILDRLIALETRTSASTPLVVTTPGARQSDEPSSLLAISEVEASTPMSEPGCSDVTQQAAITTSSLPQPAASQPVAGVVPELANDVTERFINAIGALNSVRSNHFCV